MRNRPIGVFDSGVGGLSVLAEMRYVMPNESYVYFADESNAPYGNKSNRFIKKRAIFLCGALFDMKCKAVVIACNTATCVAINSLRKRFSQPIYGVEPPILPAVSKARGGKVLVLTTKATARQKKLRQLVKKSSYDGVIVSPQENLASLVEKNFFDLENVRRDVYDILSVYDRVDCVALGCTHYNYLKQMVKDYYGDSVDVFSSSSAVAQRVRDGLNKLNLLSDSDREGYVKKFCV